jgi:hypothetical protein
MKKKILTFFPYNTIWKFNIQEKSIINSLVTMGYHVDNLVCDKFMKTSCIAMTMQPTKKKQNDICKNCFKNRDYFKNKKVNNISIKKNENQKELINIKNLNNISLINFKTRGFEIGKICAHDLILTNKANNFLFDKKTFSQLREKILICLSLLDKLDEINAKDYGVVFSTNGMYSVCRLFQQYFLKKGIKAFSVLHSLNYNIEHHEIQIVNNDIQYYQYLKSKWNKIKKYKISYEAIQRVFGKLKMLYLCLHSHTFSIGKTNRDINKIFKIEKKKIVLVTLGSYDEIMASTSLGLYGKFKRDRIFKNQIDWINFLIKNFKNNKNICFIIRVHPREYHKFKSKHFYELMKLKENMPKNFFFDGPGQNISLYDYIGKIHLVLNSWSSVVAEFGCMGIPTFSYSHFSRFPLSIDYHCKNKTDYLNKIKIAINEKSKDRSITRKINYYRYLSFLTYYSSVDIKITKIFKVSYSGKIIYFFRKLYLNIIVKYFHFLVNDKLVLVNNDFRYLNSLISSKNNNFFLMKIKNDNGTKINENKLILSNLNLLKNKLKIKAKYESSF